MEIFMECKLRGKEISLGINLNEDDIPENDDNGDDWE
jgi:hypothetical protein